MNRNSEVQIKTLGEKLFAKDDLPLPFNKGLTDAEITSFLEEIGKNRGR